MISDDDCDVGIKRVKAVCRVIAVATLSLTCLLGCTVGRLSSKSPKFTPAPAAPQGYATLYIFRVWNEAGSAVWPITFLNDVKVADVEVLSYTYVYLRPGDYHLRTEKSQLVTAMGNRPFDFKIPSTQTYYLQFGNSGATTKMKVLPSTRYLPPYAQTLGQ